MERGGEGEAGEGEHGNEEEVGTKDPWNWVEVVYLLLLFRFYYFLSYRMQLFALYLKHVLFSLYWVEV